MGSKTKNLSEKELRAFYDRIMDKPHFRVYMTIHNQLEKVCTQFDNTTIDVSGESDDAFKNFLAFIKTTKDLLENMESMMGKLDPERVAEIKKLQTKASETSLEGFILRGNE